MNSKLVSLIMLAGVVISPICVKAYQYDYSFRTNFGLDDTIPYYDEWGDPDAGEYDFVVPVVLVPNGGSGSPRMCRFVNDMEVPECPYSRSGYVFTGWKVYDACYYSPYAEPKKTCKLSTGETFCWNSGGANGVLQPGDYYDVCGNTVLAAQWKAGWVVKFNYNGAGCCGLWGEEKFISKGSAKSKAVGKLPGNPGRTGYTFNGWWTKKSGGTKVTTKTKISKNTTFYAHWKAKNYTISLKKKGKGTVSGGGKKAYKSAITLKAKPSSGYKFAGWQDNDGEIVSTKATWKTKVPYGGATYTAIFKKK